MCSRVVTYYLQDVLLSRRLLYREPTWNSTPILSTTRKNNSTQVGALEDKKDFPLCKRESRHPKRRLKHFLKSFSMSFVSFSVGTVYVGEICEFYSGSLKVENLAFSLTAENLECIV